METLALVAPSPQLGDGVIALSPITGADGVEIVAMGHTQGFIPLFDPALLELQVEDSERFRIWVAKRAGLWNSFELPVTMQDACFAVREAGASALAGVVGFNRPNGSAYSGRLNVYYWTAPTMRGHGIAAKAVVAAVSWALATFRAAEAFIRAANPESERVADKAGFSRSGDTIDGAPVFKLRP
jgi:RimJ/RimL family protein N-acetyltransferase